MVRSDGEQSPFDKNLRSLLDAIAMFEREAGLVFERFGLDSDAVARVMDLLGSLSSEAVRPLAGALGIADAATVESLARDVRALLQGEARLRREQAASASRLDDMLAALEALGSTTARLAELQGRTQDRLDALAERTAAIEGTDEQRRRLADEVARLQKRIDGLESTLSAQLGFLPAETADAESDLPPGIKAGGGRRPAPRTVRTTSASQKILEGLPTLEPKVRPA
ncbi:MAG: hypothetical protein ABR538_03290 [Candidatus Binatia bacterium]